MKWVLVVVVVLSLLAAASAMNKDSSKKSTGAPPPLEVPRPPSPIGSSGGPTGSGSPPSMPARRRTYQQGDSVSGKAPIEVQAAPYLVRQGSSKDKPPTPPSSPTSASSSRPSTPIIDEPVPPVNPETQVCRLDDGGCSCKIRQAMQAKDPAGPSNDVAPFQINTDAAHAPLAGWANNPNALEAIVKAKGHQVGPGHFEPTDPPRVERCQHLATATPPPAPDKSPIGLMSGPYPAQHMLRHHFPILAAPIQKVRQGDRLVDAPRERSPRDVTAVEYVYQPRNCWDVTAYAEDQGAITADSDEYITGCAPYKKHAQRLRQFIDCGNEVFAGITRWDDQRGEFKAAVAAERGKIKLEMEAHATFDDYADFSIENPASYLKRIAFLALTSTPDEWANPDFFKVLFYMDATKPNYAKRIKELGDKLQKAIDAVNPKRRAEGKPEFRVRPPPKRTMPDGAGEKEFLRRPVALFGYTHIEDTVYDYEFAYMTEGQETAFQQCFGGPGTPEAKSLQHAFFMYPTMMGAVGQLAHGLSQHDNYYITGGETPEHLRGESKSVMPHSQYVLRMGVPPFCARKATELTSNFALSKYASTTHLVFMGYLKTYSFFDWHAMCDMAHDGKFEFSNCRVFAQCWVKAVQRACAIDPHCCADAARGGHDACKGNKWDSSACRQSLFHIVDEAVYEDPYPRSNVKGWLPPWARTTAEDKSRGVDSPHVDLARPMAPMNDNPHLTRMGTGPLGKRSNSMPNILVPLTDRDLHGATKGGATVSAPSALPSSPRGGPVVSDHQSPKGAVKQ